MKIVFCLHKNFHSLWRSFHDYRGTIIAYENHISLVEELLQPMKLRAVLDQVDYSLRESLFIYGMIFIAYESSNSLVEELLQPMKPRVILDQVDYSLRELLFIHRVILIAYESSYSLVEELLQPMMISCRAKKFPYKAHSPFDERRSADILHDAPLTKNEAPSRSATGLRRKRIEYKDSRDHSFSRKSDSSH